MSETEQNKKSSDDAPRQDWNKLAQDALDLWQNHLTALANDQALKDDMARMVAPMSQMFEQWTTAMNQGFASVMPEATPTATPTSAPPKEKTESAATPTSSAPASSAPTPAAPEQPPLDKSDKGESLASAPEHAAPPSRADAPVQPRARTRSTPADGARDLAELASRLAKLERELETGRTPAKRSDGDVGALAGEDATLEAPPAGDIQRVAGTGS